MLLLVLAKLLTPRYKNKNVAIKVVNKGETPEEIKKREGRFAREVAMLSKVQHKNLVKFIGACKEPVSVIVTELLVGGTLRKYLVNMRPRCLDLRVAVGFALDIARAMECLHSHGIIHRDLKPEAVEGEVPGHPNPLVQINYTLPYTASSSASHLNPEQLSTRSCTSVAWSINVVTNKPPKYDEHVCKATD
ncbi:Protein kinase domain-containing protein [Heracleum sosnowskyi]|uniref:Protein kinase domain-containing protein n=1 Tax=Heracleum sosnowskyi TaxID=360622 RepID=A0AAD8IAL9_9APIA|nr:Protein kinase domain-containing protein [Heracleum sosnowskyi]